MTGTMDGGCVGGFSYELRVFMLDVAIIENVSSVPITVNDMLGDRLTDTHLRVASSSSQANLTHELGLVVGSLAPGHPAMGAVAYAGIAKIAKPTGSKL
jgi:hypothetical protein